jgi:mRNA interferase RelE/StbE
VTYRVLLESHARRVLLKLAPDLQNRISDALDGLSRNPGPPGIKRLGGSPGYRIRSGDYRILLTVQDQNRTVIVYRIGDRKDAYRLL